MAEREQELVVQFTGEADDIEEAVQALEDELISLLGERADVDGHEAGEGTVSIKIHCKSAERVWARIERTVEDAGDLELNAVAYRPLDGDDYTVIWPPDFDGEFEV